MRILVVFVLSVFSLNSLSCEVVPFARLLANPKIFSGKCVETVGVISVEFEGLRIYSDRESYEFGVYENSIGHTYFPDIDSDVNTEGTFKLFSKHYEGKLVRYKGVFNRDESYNRLPSPSGVFSEHQDIIILDKWRRNIKAKNTE